MKIFVLDDIIVCSLDNKNSSFLTETHGCFDGFYKHNLKLRNASFDSVLDCLMLVLIEADKHGIEVSEEVRKTYHAMCEWQRTIVEGLRAQQRLEEEEKKKKEQWKRLQKYGCIDCKNCKPTGFDDDYKCLASGDELPIDNSPGYVGMIYVLFNYTPFPTDNCPYRYQI